MNNDKQQTPQQPSKEPMNPNPDYKAPGSQDRPLEGPDFDVRHDKITPTAQAGGRQSDLDDSEDMDSDGDLDDESTDSARSNVKACGTKASGGDSC